MHDRALTDATAVPFMMAEMAIASWETILRRSLMMAEGRCTVTEYQKMLTEKLNAAKSSAMAIMTTGSVNAALSPWHRASVANAKRLRRTG